LSTHGSGYTGPQQTDRQTNRHRVMPPTPSVATVTIKIGNDRDSWWSTHGPPKFR